MLSQSSGFLGISERKRDRIRTWPARSKRSLPAQADPSMGEGLRPPVGSNQEVAQQLSQQVSLAGFAGLLLCILELALG